MTKFPVYTSFENAPMVFIKFRQRYPDVYYIFHTAPNRYGVIAVARKPDSSEIQFRTTDQVNDFIAGLRKQHYVLQQANWVVPTFEATWEYQPRAKAVTPIPQEEGSCEPIFTEDVCIAF